MFQPNVLISLSYIFVTEFWKISHMGASEMIRIFIFSELLRIKRRKQIKKRIFLSFTALRMTYNHYEVNAGLHCKSCYVIIKYFTYQMHPYD